MTDGGELRKYVKQLSNPNNTEQDVLGVLRILKKDFHVTEAILRESKAGLAVGKLRSHSSKSVSDLAKEIVKKWKLEVEKAKSKATGAGTVQPNGKAARKGSVNGISSPPSNPYPKGPPKLSNPSSARNAKNDGIKIDLTGDKTRDKCMELIYDALASDSGAPSEQILKPAKAIENCVHSQYSGTTAEYKAKIRSLFVNLKDKNNPSLRESIVSGDLSAEKFSKMSSAEMASEERKAADSKIKEQNLFNSLGAEEQQAETDAFQCGRCKQRKCRYRQAQTRSADEPMTTFVTCTNCNNRWKFS
jgi:transcription elongation factor S-II